MSSFSIATFNVNYICKGNGCKNAEQVLKTILECGADMVCLQESNEKWDAFVGENTSIQAIYPHVRFYNHFHVWGGFAMLSKFPIEGWKVLKETDKWWYPAGLATVRVPSSESSNSKQEKDQILQVLIVHLRAPMEFSPEPYWWGGRVNWIGGFFSKRVKANRLDEIVTFSNALDPSLPAVIVGDFNEPSSSSGCTRYLEDNLGFLNLPKKAQCGLGIHAKNSWRVQLGFLTLLSFDYDHILFNKAHLEAVDNTAQVGGDSGSDHRLVSAKLSFLTD